MKNWYRGMIVGACVAALSATAQSPSTTTRPAPGATGTTGGAATATGTAGTMADLPQIPNEPKAYMDRLHHANQTEIELSQLAVSKTQNPQVRDLANMLIKDHKAANQKLTSAAEQQKLGKLGEPKPMNDMERKSMAATKSTKEMLETLNGVQFDRVFLSNMVTSHDKSLGKLMAGQRQFGTAPWSNLITEMIPKVSAHRDQAYRMLGQVKPNVGVGGAGNADTQQNPHEME